MKTINVNTAKKKLREILRQAQVEHVAIVNEGRPIAIVLGVDGQDLESVIGMGEDLAQLRVRYAKESAAKYPESAVTQDEMERTHPRQRAPGIGSKRRRKPA